MTRSLRGFLKRHGSPGFGKAVNLLRELKIDVPVKKYVDLVGQIARTDVFIAKIEVGDFALIERVAQPADGIRIRPRHPNTKARRFGRVTRHARGRRRRGEIKS